MALNTVVTPDALPFRGLAAYTANLCRIRRGGAASHSRPHTIILHNESGDGKRFFLHLITNLWGPPAGRGLRGTLQVLRAKWIPRLKGLQSDGPRWALSVPLELWQPKTQDRTAFGDTLRPVEGLLVERSHPPYILM